MPAPLSSLHPVLVADLASPGARDFLVGVSLARGSVYIPLIGAPTSAVTHRLEVYTPGSATPTLFFAEPLGAATVSGFPLALRPYDESEVSASPRASGERAAMRHETQDAPASQLRPRESTSFPQRELSKNHTRDLEGGASSGPVDDLVGRSIAGGKLRIDALIGKGGVGAVYRAMHRDLRIAVAVKVLHAHFQVDVEFCRRFHAEALAASRLDHPNLMRVVDFGQEPDGLLYLAMEFLDGYPLASVMHIGEPMPVERIVHLMMQVSAGLGHAHSRGIVHRDVKPENVVIVAGVDDDEQPADHVKLCDFGIAVVGEGQSVVAGTPDYMSPEQCRGELLDGRSDVYACGILLYELATGRMPFEDAESATAILNRHMHVVPRPPHLFEPNIDPRLEMIIMKALAKEPSERQDSMRDLRRELRALLESPPSIPPRSSIPPLSQERTTSGTFERQPDGPEWLERSGNYRHDSIGEVDTGDMHARLLATELAQRPTPWLATFAAEHAEPRFELLANRLSAALPLLAAERNVRTLFAVRSTLDGLAAEDPKEPSWRSVRAQTILLAFLDPPLLGWLSEAALASDRPPREVMELLARAGVAATYALYSTRLKNPDIAGIRPRFSAIVRELGEAALPMIRAGLGRLVARRDLDVAATLALDLFESSPAVRDDAAGDVTVLYLEEPTHPVLIASGARALVRFWGPRAAPVLLALLSIEDERVKDAAITGLKQLNVYDDYAMRLS